MNPLCNHFERKLFDKIKKDHDVCEIYEAKNLMNVIQTLQNNQKEKLSLDLILYLHRVLLT
jgi:hypothetical protein